MLGAASAALRAGNFGFSALGFWVENSYLPLMKKITTFIYGIFAYLIFLMTAIYTIGFLGNFIVPKSINSGLGISFISSLFINLSLLSLFAVQHSVMARASFKKWLAKFMNPAIERSTYVLLSSLALILLYWKWQPMKTIIWQVENEVISWVIWGIFGIGWLVVFASTFMINHFELTGLQQVLNYLRQRQAASTKFEVNYLYKFVRHPLMLGFLIVFWATPLMTVGHLVFTLILTLYIFVAVKYLEEKDLRKAIGEEYEAYQKEVPMIVPFTKIKK